MGITEEEIRERWIELMKAHHPDKVGNEGSDKAKKINEAYDVLAAALDRHHGRDFPLRVTARPAVQRE